MIDMRRIAAGNFPALAQAFAERLDMRGRHHQHRRHAHRVRHFEIAREVLEHRGALRHDVMQPSKLFVGLARRLRFEIGGDDVERVLEMAMQFQPRDDGVGVLSRTVGQDELAARQFLDRAA